MLKLIVSFMYKLVNHAEDNVEIYVSDHVAQGIIN